MEARYSALAEGHGRVAAEVERLKTENEALREVRSAWPTQLTLVPWLTISVHPALCTWQTDCWLGPRVAGCMWGCPTSPCPAPPRPAPAGADGSAGGDIKAQDHADGARCRAGA